MQRRTDFIWQKATIDRAATHGRGNRNFQKPHPRGITVATIYRRSKSGDNSGPFTVQGKSGS